MGQSHLCAENVGKHLQLKGIGGHMKRTAESCGIARVDQISNTRDRLKITSGRSEKAIIHTLLLMVLRMRRNASRVLRMMNLLAEFFYSFSYLSLSLSLSLFIYIDVRKIKQYSIRDNICICLSKLVLSNKKFSRNCWRQIGSGLLRSICWAICRYIY
jgi:hypothetical protein